MGCHLERQDTSILLPWLWSFEAKTIYIVVVNRHTVIWSLVILAKKDYIWRFLKFAIDNDLAKTRLSEKGKILFYGKIQHFFTFSQNIFLTSRSKFWHFMEQCATSPTTSRLIVAHRLHSATPRGCREGHHFGYTKPAFAALALQEELKLTTSALHFFAS